MKHLFLALFLLLVFLAEAFAESSKDCSGLNHPNFEEEYRACLRVKIAARAAEAGVDCVDCLFQQEEQQPAAWVQALSALAQPLAYLGSAYVVSKYQYKSQEAWAQAYANGFTQCTNRFNSYLNYTTEMGANPVTTDEAKSLMNTCNGNGYGGYAGFGGMVGNGYGGYTNPMIGAGYSGGFLGGMVGPNYGGMSGGGFGVGLGIGMYSGLSGSLYGGNPYGMYGNLGMGMSPYGMNYSSPYSGVYGAGMNYAGAGINPMYATGGANYGVSPYAAGNISASFGLNVGGSAGYAF
jgi:hypothetical protein